MHLKNLTPSDIKRFRKTIYQHYEKHGRNLPWRRTANPYRILVSEIMLQQTQVERVLGKYREFLKAFPDFQTLNKAPLSAVLSAWQGMGYNRRSIALKEIAKRVTKDFKGALPDSVDVLTTFSGIGYATASAICAFAFKQPAVFIETNIRRVFIHFFFHDRDNIRDADILPLVEKTLDRRNPRAWYYALMDYGVMLKWRVPNPNKRSAHYQKHAPFVGSNRQMRGKILKSLLERPKNRAEIVRELKLKVGQAKTILVQLERERFVVKKGENYIIP